MADANLGTAVLRTKLDSTGLKTGLSGAKRETEKFAGDSTRAIGGIGAAFAAVAASAGVRSYISFLTSSANLAQQADAANRLFEKSLGRTNQSLTEGAALVQRLSDRFGVANSIIESSATLLLRQGASLDDIERALTAAGASAAAAGFDISTAFDNVAIAVATGRSELLETSGIVTNLGPVTQAYAKSIGKTVDELTQQEVIQARVNAIYKETASEIEDVDEILQGLPQSQANWTKELRTFRETAGGLGRDVLVPILNAGTGLLSMINDLPDPVIRAGTAMAGAALGATALATGIVAIKAAMTGLSGLGLLSFGPAGWIVLGVTAVAGLVAVLSGRPDSLDAAVGKASDALAAGDADSLIGALDKVIGKVDGDTRTSLQGLQDELRTTGDVGVEMAERIHEALTQAATAPLRAELEVVRHEAAEIERLLGTVESPDKINARIAEIESQGNALLDSGQEVPLSLVNELTMLRGLAEGIELSTANSARDQERLNKLREREAQLLRDIEAASGPGVNVPPAAPPSANQSPATSTTAGPAGTPSDPVTVRVDSNTGYGPPPAALLGAVAGQAGLIAADTAAAQRASRLTALEEQLATNVENQRQRNVIYADTQEALAVATERATAAMLSVEPSVADLGARAIGDAGVTAVLPEARPLVAPNPTSIVLDVPHNWEETVAAALRASGGASALLPSFGGNVGLTARSGAADLARDTVVALVEAEAPLSEIRAAVEAWTAVMPQTREAIDAVTGGLIDLRVEGEKFISASQTLALRGARTSDFTARGSGGRFGDAPIIRREDAERNARLQEEAAEQFKDTVIRAGLSFAQSIEQGIRTGDPGAVVTGGIGAIGSIASGLVGGPLGTIISGIIPIVTGIFGGLFGGNNQREEEDRRRAAERSRSTVSALHFEFIFNQTNTFTGELQSSRNQAALRESGLVTFRDLEALLKRTVLPKLNGLEAKVAALT